jgi:hypothetical protein
MKNLFLKGFPAEPVMLQNYYRAFAKLITDRTPLNKSLHIYLLRL